jgi:pyruvate dehydrogenase E1 component alpha subunit
VDAAEDVEATPESMFDHVFAADTPRIDEGRASLRAIRERHGDEALQRDD